MPRKICNNKELINNLLNKFKTINLSNKIITKTKRDTCKCNLLEQIKASIQSDRQKML
jgi:hypothetical protein